MTLASNRDLLTALQGGSLRFINDEQSGSLIVERTSDLHQLSFGAVRRFAQLSGYAAPGVVLLLNERDQLTGSDKVEQLIKSEPKRFDVVHAVCFPAGFKRTVQWVRRRKLEDGVWEVAFSTESQVPRHVEEWKELQVLQRWLESILQHRDAAPAHSGGTDPLSVLQHDDDDDQTQKASSLSRRTALRDRLRKDIEMIYAGQWASLAGNSGRNPSAALGKYKAQGRLFAVSDGNRDMYPAFQFSDDTKPKPAIAQVLTQVPEAARGWPLLSWFNARNVFLKNRKPLDVIDSDPDAVADAADRFFGRDD
jgi:hypothetical protein